MRIFVMLSLLFAVWACQSTGSSATAQTGDPIQKHERLADPSPDYSASETPSLAEAKLDEQLNEYSKAIFASGCFWCTEEVFQRVKGVRAVYSGYIGGEKKRPTYYGVSNGNTGYAEAVIVYYDPEVVSYDLLLEFFYASHDPTQVNRQGPDVGTQYRSGVFYLDEAQQAAAVAYQEKLGASEKYAKPIATEITQATTFYLAEEYHQDYYPAHPENPYIQRVSKPKVEKFAKAYAKYLH